jgi:hypothetical protein
MLSSATAAGIEPDSLRGAMRVADHAIPPPCDLIPESMCSRPTLPPSLDPLDASHVGHSEMVFPQRGEVYDGERTTAPKVA